MNTGGDALRRHLLTRPDGASPLDVGREVLRLTGPESVIRRLAEAALRETAGVTEGPDGRFRLEISPDARRFAVAGLATGPFPDWDDLLEIAVLEVGGGRTGVSFASFVHPRRPLPPPVRERFRPLLRRLEEAPSREEILDTLAPLLAGADLLCFDDDVVARFLRRALPTRSSPGSTVRLVTVLRRTGRIGRGADLPAAAAAFGVPCPDDPRAGDAARAIALLDLAAAESGAAEPGARPPFDFSRTSFGSAELREIPPRPGVYRFLDDAGRVLYVGKARDLRRRVAGYFRPRARRRRLHEEMMERVRDLRWTETGSEVAALLLEHRQIREEAPPYNVQRAVRRKRKAAGDLALLLPGAVEREVEILLVRNGAPAGRATSDRRARGMREVRAALRRAIFSKEPPPADSAGEQILATFLRAEADRVNYVDLGEVSGMNDAARRIRAALTDPDLFSRKAFYR